MRIACSRGYVMTITVMKFYMFHWRIFADRMVPTKFKVYLKRLSFEQANGKGNSFKFLSMLLYTPATTGVDV